MCVCVVVVFFFVVVLFKRTDCYYMCNALYVCFAQGDCTEDSTIYRNLRKLILVNSNSMTYYFTDFLN